MEVFNKIGFHAGPAGNMFGIGDFMQRLDEQGIPFFMKSADQYGILFEAANLAAASGVAHTLVYRLSTAGQADGFDYDVPDYNVTPKEAAIKHWEQTLSKMPPEFDKRRVWIEPINEIDKGRADWLGHFAIHISELANEAGYKLSLFGWSSGEPEREGWETEGMLRFLRLCAKHPKRIAVSLHEYDHGLHGFDAVYPFHVGRFQVLFDVCDQNRIPRPTVHITEWGWAYDHVPTWEIAKQHIEKANELYAKYPQIAGAAIWNLGSGPQFGDVHNQTQRLIRPLADFALTERYVVADDIEQHPAAIDPELREGDEQPVPPGSVVDDPLDDPEDDPFEEPVEDPVDDPIDEPPPEEPPVTITPGMSYVADVTIPDDTRLPAGTPFTKTWLVENDGNIAWLESFRLKHVDGSSMGETTEISVPAVQPGQQERISLELTAPEEVGTFFGDWRLHDGAGNPFGDFVFLRIITETVPEESGISNGQFVADITVPDDTRMQPGRRFVKTWRVRNNGERTWGTGYRLLFDKGSAMTHRLHMPLPLAAPGQTVEISISLTAPTQRGTYFGDWRLTDDENNPFGDVVFLRIVVV